MKGREAVRAAQRRETQTRDELAQVKAQLRDERDRHHRREVELESEASRLRNDIRIEAGAIAAEQVKKKLAEADEERRQRGLSDDIVIYFTYQKDWLIRNACRYLSMTKNMHPRHALALVLTWATDHDIDYLLNDRESFFLDLGLPMDGFVATEIRIGKKQEKRFPSAAMTLSRALAEGHEDIHPDYTVKQDAEWYPPAEWTPDPPPGIHRQFQHHGKNRDNTRIRKGGVT